MIPVRTYVVSVLDGKVCIEPPRRRVSRPRVGELRDARRERSQLLHLVEIVVRAELQAAGAQLRADVIGRDHEAHAREIGASRAPRGSHWSRCRT
jgi:hypothetical protein